MVGPLSGARDAVTGHLVRPAPDAPDADWIGWANRLPVLTTCRLRCVELGAAVGVFVIESTPDFPPNPNGAVNGGFIASAIDQTLGVVASRASPPGTLPATANLQVQYHRPARAPLTLRTSVLPGGRRVLFLEVVVRDGGNVRCATGHGTMVVGGAGRFPDDSAAPPGAP